MAKVGLQTGNQHSASTYLTNYTSRSRLLIESAYRSSWICGKVVDSVAEDMTREGIAISGETDPTALEQLEREATHLRVWDRLCDSIRWARLYGGCLAVLAVAGQDYATPLNMNTIGRGQFRGLLVFDRWMMVPSLTELVEEVGPDFGLPRWYDIIGGYGAPAMRVHYSRVMRFEGDELPYFQRIQEQFWGQSVLERVWDRITAFDSTTLGAAQLVYKAHLRTIRMQGLRDNIATGGKAFDAVVANIKMIAQFQSNEGVTLLDQADEFETTSYTFAGLDDVLLQFSQQLSGASGIPLTRLFGQSPAGLNATGESDTRNYYDTVKQQQERRLRHAVSRVYDCMHRSLTGRGLPPEFDFTFRNLWQMTSAQRAEVAGQNTTAIINAYDSQIISQRTALEELRQQSAETGLFTNITDDDIKAADDEVAPSAGELGVDVPGSQPGDDNADPGAVGKP